MGAQRDDRGHRTPDRLTVRTVPVSDPGDLVTRLPDTAPLAWIRRGDGLAGWGAAAMVTLPAGEDRFTAGEKWLRELFDDALVIDDVRAPGTGPVAFGSFTFDPASDGSVLVVPQVVLGRRSGTYWRTTIGDGRDEPAQSGSGSDQPSWPGARDGVGRSGPATSTPEVSWHDGSLTAPQWERAVAAAVTRIRDGQLRKAVLARDLHAEAAIDIDPRLLLHRLTASYPDCYTFSCGGLVGATPELLIRRDGETVSSLVLAGTIQRGGNPADDDALAAALLSSAKDIEEHSYAVADVRAALGPVCDRLEIDQHPFLLRLANVQHLATRVAGQLAETGTEHSALTLAAALHPTAAVCGTPAAAAMELIRELEGMDRGRYAGPVGWVDAQGNGEWGIALRCAELDGPRARLFAGCGIVADSDPAAELAEAQAKFRTIQDALEG